jgi:hypothetical protein
LPKVSTIGRYQDGIDVSNPDVITPEEIEEYRSKYLGSNKGLLDSFEFWLEFRPDVLKRHKARTRHFHTSKEADYPLVTVLTCLHHYTIQAFQEGVAYEIRSAQSMGALRSDILDALSVAWIHAGHRGMYSAAACSDYLRSYVDPQVDERFPPGWSFDPNAFDSGMDFSQREASTEDINKLVAWYERVVGEVPRYVKFLAMHRPGLLKAQRNRYEHAIQQSLPQQFLPYMLLNFNVARGFREGIRENVLLGRSLGLTHEQLLDAICLGVLHSGLDAIGVADEAAGDLLLAIDG